MSAATSTIENLASDRRAEGPLNHEICPRMYRLDGELSVGINGMK
jgi:hypothetical protein